MSDSETDETTVKSHILNSFCFLESYEVKSIQQWICSGAFEEELETKKSIKNVEKQMRRIGKYIKKMVPFKAEMPTEKVTIPTIGEQADCTPATTLHVDQFLYEQHELDNQIARNVMPSHYCGDCNSRNIKRMTFISHSMSKEEIGYTFKVFFPRDLENKNILDIGSRFGTVLYGAYYLTNATCIIGVEINNELCEIQRKIIERFGMDPNRIRIVNSDILLKGDIVAAADAVTMNAIDFFVDIESHIKVWCLLKQHMKKGSYLIYKGIVENTLRSLNIYDDFLNWVTICQPCQLENEIFFDVEDGSDLAFYIVN